MIYYSKTKGKFITFFVFETFVDYYTRRTLNEHLDNAQYCPAIFRKKELHDESANKKSLRPLVLIEE